MGEKRSDEGVGAGATEGEFFVGGVGFLRVLDGARDEVAPA